MTLILRMLAVLAALMVIGTSARADLTITVQEDSGATNTVVSVIGAPTSNLVGAVTTYGTTDYTIQVLSGQAYQTTNLTELLSSAVSITNTTGSSGHVLHLVITGTGYTAPVTPPNVQALSHIGGTVPAVTTPSTNTLNFQSYVAGVGLGVQSPPITSVGSYASDKSSIITSLASPYSIAQRLDITLNKLNDQINYSSSTTLNSVVPEPSSMAVAGLGAIAFIGYGLRRRFKK